MNLEEVGKAVKHHLLNQQKKCKLVEVVFVFHYGFQCEILVSMQVCY